MGKGSEHPQRQLSAPAFPDDTGAADPAVTRALAAYAEGSGSYVEALAALQDSRLLVPIVALLGEVEVGPDGLAREKTSDMAAVLLTRPDGRRGLLAFTSMATMHAWDPQARPAPVTARLAALSAVQEQASALVVDVAGPDRLVVEGRNLRALASGWRLGRVGDDLAWIGPVGE